LETEPPLMINNTSRIPEKAIVLLVFLFGIWYFCFRILGYGLEYIPGDLGDSRFINYLLEHGYTWLSGNTDSFWTAHFMHPFQNSIALSDPMIGTQVFYAPWRAAGIGAETAYQLWWICICTLNFWVAYWSFNKVFRNKLLAALLAWVFAFSVFNLGQLNYMQMIIRFPVALAFYSAYRFTAQTSLKYFGIYCFAVVYQFYCVPYTGFYLLYFSLLFIVVYLFVTKAMGKTLRSYFNRQTVFKTLGIVALSAVLLAVLLVPYAAMSETVGLRLYKEVVPNVPELKSYLLVHESSVPWRFLFNRVRTPGEAWWLYYLFPGMLLLLTLVFSVFFLGYKWLKKQEVQPLLKTGIIVSAIICLLHLRIGDNATLYALIFKLPGINSMRVLNRFMHVELFLLLLIFGFFVSRLNYKLLPVLFLAVVLDNSFDPAHLQRESKQALVKRKEQLISAIKKHEGYEQKMLAVVDTLAPAYQTHITAMLAAQQLGMKTINGYSSYCPDAFGDYFTTCSANGLNKWLHNQQLKPEEVLILKTAPTNER
jgi:hypothetical protein